MEDLQTVMLKESAKKMEVGLEDTFSYVDFPSEHWTRIHTTNVIKRLNCVICRRTRAMSCSPKKNSALMLVCARQRNNVIAFFKELRDEIDTAYLHLSN